MCDNGLLIRCANNTGIIDVTRNQFAPFFVNEPYEETIQETRPRGDTILTLTAQDQDLIGNLVYEAVTTSYPFAVNRLSGAVTLAFEGNLFYGPPIYSVS